MVSALAIFIRKMLEKLISRTKMWVGNWTVVFLIQSKDRLMFGSGFYLDLGWTLGVREWLKIVFAQRGGLWGTVTSSPTRLENEIFVSLRAPKLLHRKKYGHKFLVLHSKPMYYLVIQFFHCLTMKDEVDCCNLRKVCSWCSCLMSHKM